MTSKVARPSILLLNFSDPQIKLTITTVSGEKIIGNILQILVFLFVDKNIKDTQCGFKLYNKKYVKNIFNLLNENGFAHDIELIFLLKRKGIKIKELPVTWKHIGNSKLNPFFESIRFFIRFIIIFLKYNLRK